MGFKSHTSIVHFEAGKQNFPLKKVVKMAELLGIPDDELMKAMKQGEDSHAN